MISNAVPGGRCSRIQSSIRFEPQVEISNQTVAAAEAAYRQSLAVIKEAQAGLFPVVTLNYNVTGSHFGAAAIGSALGTGVTKVVSTLCSSASWDLDLWGKIRRTVESDVAGAQVSAAELANAKLSAQALLATAYYNLRAADALQALLNRTVTAFKRTLEITQNQYKAGTVSKADVATAQAQVLNTQAQAINVGMARAQFEHAIAALMGRPPADLSIPPSPLGYKLPDIPVSVPSALLERRPDIAAAERYDAAAECSHWRRYRPLLSRCQPVRRVRFHGDWSARAHGCQ